MTSISHLSHDYIYFQKQAPSFTLIQNNDTITHGAISYFSSFIFTRKEKNMQLVASTFMISYSFIFKEKRCDTQSPYQVYLKHSDSNSITYMF